jgi:hypothetical protein
VSAQRVIRLATIVAGMLVAAAPHAAAQGLDGYISLTGDAFPAVRQESGPRSAFSELRARLFAERALDLGEHWRVTLAGFAEGLVADRGRPDTITDLAIEAQEAYLEGRWPHADLRVGLSRVVWGRLDEVQPTDVINALDLTRFFFEGRSEARRAVPIVRARWLPTERLAVEGVYVPWFRRGRFDELDDESSAFNLTPSTTCAAGSPPPCVALPRVSNEPSRAIENAQGGLRLNVTSGQVDWALSAYRGFEPLPLFEIVGPPLPDTLPTVIERFPRFTMLGGDFETVRGEWGVRGEIAAYVERSLQAIDQPQVVDGRSVEGGVGIDRSAGPYRISGNVIVGRRWQTAASMSSTAAPVIDESDVNLVASIDRTFARETRRLRAFGVYNPGEDSVFARLIATFSLRDNVSLEASGGLFVGDGDDVLSRFASRDFVYVRLKVFY